MSIMLLFLASLIEQLDLALEHVKKSDLHNARFGLMLTDNAVELVLHEIAKQKQEKLKLYSFNRKSYEHQQALDKALLRSFHDKVKFARIDDKLQSSVASTFKTMHEIRNELYHAGLKHEEILINLSYFYFDTACQWIGEYMPYGLSWYSGQKMPQRAKKYFNEINKYFPGSLEEFQQACAMLRKACGHEPVETIAILAAHMERIIDHQDTCIGIIADGVYEGQKRTRDRAVVECQTWPLAFSKVGEAFAAEKGWSGNRLALAAYLSDNYPVKIKSDPIVSWRKRVKKLADSSNPHAALIHFNSFMLETAVFRNAVEQSALAVEVEIDSIIDQRRGK